MSGVGTRGACVEPLGHKRERWWVTSSMNTFSNTGNIPTLHQPTVTVTTVTLTHWLPTVAEPHHLPQVWFSGIYSCWLYSHYILQDIVKCSGCEDCECINTIGNMYPAIKAMVDNICEVAKREMKEKNDGDLGSWKRAVTTADGTWQTRGFLCYHYLCRRGYVGVFALGH